MEGRIARAKLDLNSEASSVQAWCTAGVVTRFPPLLGASSQTRDSCSAFSDVPFTIPFLGAPMVLRAGGPDWVARISSMKVIGYNAIAPSKQKAVAMTCHVQTKDVGKGQTKRRNWLTFNDVRLCLCCSSNENSPDKGLPGTQYST